MPNKKYNSRYLTIRILDNELTLTLTPEGNNLLHTLLVSATDAGVKWKISSIAVMASLCDGLDSKVVEELEQWIDVKDSKLLSSLVEELWWQGEVDLVDSKD